MRFKTRTLASIFGLALASCGAPNSAPAGAVPNFSGVRSPAAPASASPAYATETCVHSPCPAPSGLVQQLGGTTISDGVADPMSLALDRSGTLYVANAATGTGSTGGSVSVYPSGASTPSRTITGFPGMPHWIAVAPSGVLFVVSNMKNGCCSIVGSVVEYASRTGTQLRSLNGVGGFPNKPAFDTSGNAYIPNFETFPGWVAVYRPGAKSPFRTIQSGIGFPLALAFDGAGNLYALSGTFSGGDEISVYAPGGSTPTRTISNGLSDSSDIAFDASGDLYVSNRGTNKVPSSVAVFAPGASTPARTIRTGIRDPIALGIDASGTLYVANVPLHGYGNVTVYAPGADAPEKTYRFRQGVGALVVSRRALP